MSEPDGADGSAAVRGAKEERPVTDVEPLNLTGMLAAEERPDERSPIAIACSMLAMAASMGRSWLEGSALEPPVADAAGEQAHAPSNRATHRNELVSSLVELLPGKTG